MALTTLCAHNPECQLRSLLKIQHGTACDLCSKLDAMHANNTSLTALSIIKPCFDPIASELERALTENTTVKSLSIPFSYMSTAGALALASGIVQNHALEYLHIDRSKLHSSHCWYQQPTIDAKGTIAIICAAASRPLLAMAITRFPIGRDVQGITFSASLIELTLTYAQISGETAVRLAEQIRDHSALQVLNLSNNPLGDEGAQELATAIVNHRTLRSVTLETCRIKGPGAASFIPVIHANTVLQKLSMGEDNEIPETTQMLLARALNNNHTLIVLATTPAWMPFFPTEAAADAATLKDKHLLRNQRLLIRRTFSLFKLILSKNGVVIDEIARRASYERQLANPPMGTHTPSKRANKIARLL
ncbi:MAG: hypothetical protein ACHQUC_05645 [Chlamydiales bacterium]